MENPSLFKVNSGRPDEARLRYQIVREDWNNGDGGGVDVVYSERERHFIQFWRTSPHAMEADRLEDDGPFGARFRYDRCEATFACKLMDDSTGLWDLRTLEMNMGMMNALVREPIALQFLDVLDDNGKRFLRYSWDRGLSGVFWAEPESRWGYPKLGDEGVSFTAEEKSRLGAFSTSALATADLGVEYDMMDGIDGVVADMTCLTVGRPGLLVEAEEHVADVRRRKSQAKSQLFGGGSLGGLGSHRNLSSRHK